ncbi:MAG: MarR family winged helix-turn-helix transcriptional regulator [Acidimicrobiales bacterium]
MTYLLKRLELAVRAEMDAIAGQFGVTALQYTALSVLHRHPGMSGAQLARRSFVSPQAGSEMIAVLERKGLVARSPDAANRRIRRIDLTAEGRALLVACDREMDALERTMLAGLGAEDVARLAAFLAACVGSLAGGDGVRQRGSRGPQKG